MNEIINKLSANNFNDAYLRAFHIESGLCYMALDSDGYFSLLISTNSRKQLNASTDILSLSLSNKCKIDNGEKVFDAYCHILRCTTKEKSTLRTFLLLSLTMAKEINELNNHNIVIEYFEDLIRLFKTSPNPNLESARQGLWGELFLISIMDSIIDWTSFWHNEPQRKFDFSYNHKRLEVKTTLKEQRIHKFSHGQLYRDDGTSICISSFILQKEDSGLSLKSLIDKIAQEVSEDTKLSLKLQKSIREVGMHDTSDEGPRYDEQLALKNLKFYFSEDVPRYNLNEPPGVSNTSYNIDLSNINSIEKQELDEWLLGWNIQ